MEKILEINNIYKNFPITKGVFFSKEIASVKAVVDVNISLKKGETLGVVGESGCGKTTLGRLIVRLLEPTQGEILFQNNNIYDKKLKNKLKEEIQMIFQDPYSSLNPKMKVKDIVKEPLIVHKKGTKSEIEKHVDETLEKVGLSQFHAQRYPHEFSGGQRQRVGIARALALNPSLIVCDEPVSALDVSVQAQVINLLIDLRNANDLTYIFIAHDLAVVKHISDNVAVMYLGRIVEYADKKELFGNPLHPYTKGLLSAIPIANPKLKRKKEIIQGDIPSPIDPPSGCVFHTRCPYKMEVCVKEIPILKNYENERKVACFLY